MAAGIITVVTAQDLLAKAVRDPNKNLMSDAELTALVLKYAAQQSTYVFQYVISGKSYAVRLGGKALLFPATPFTAQDDVNYTLNADGSIVVTSGTHSGSSISVTGAPVDFRECLREYLVFLATHRANEVSQSGAFGSISESEAQAKLLEMARVQQGVFSV